MIVAGRCAFLALALGACRGGQRAGDSGAGWSDAAADAHEARVATTLDAALAPDDAIFPPTSEEFGARARHLLQAIAYDDASLAADIVFPRDGWLATRDAADPGKDWEQHVATPFRKGVHALSVRHRDAKEAQAVSLELGASMVQATPRRRAWKKLLWTVTGSRLTFVVEGRARTLSIREMVAWRGAWYVTRLR